MDFNYSEISTEDNYTTNLNISKFNESSVDFVDDKYSENYQLIKLYVVTGFLVFYALGTLFNLGGFFVLLFTGKNGILWVILQLMAADLLLFYSGTSEILALYDMTYLLQSGHCQLYKGTEVLANTVLVYLLICLNFHVLTLCSFYEKQVINDCQCLTLRKYESNECLVSKCLNPHKRIISITHGKDKNDISVTFPCSFIWIGSLSLSIPSFTLSSILKSDDVICTIVDVYYEMILEYSLLAFKNVIPLLLLVLLLYFELKKIHSINILEKENKVYASHMNNIKPQLTFATTLICLYLITSILRHINQVYTVGNNKYSIKNTDSFIVPPLYDTFVCNFGLLFFSILHHSGGIIRALTYWYLLPNFKCIIKAKIFGKCCEEKEQKTNI